MTTDSVAPAPTPAQAETPEPFFFWEHPGRSNPRYSADLAALRRGVGREAGSVPEMWEFYRMLTAEGRASEKLQAEHTTLTLYAIHQQSISIPMHLPSVGLGKALLKLRQSGKFSADAVDRRFNAAATATSLGEASYHLRGLIRQLRGLPQGLDYTRFFQDLVAWQDPDQISTVRRRWGRDYFIGRDQAEKTS